jgi:hypothetical protein
VELEVGVQGHKIENPTQQRREAALVLGARVVEVANERPQDWHEDEGAVEVEQRAESFGPGSPAGGHPVVVVVVVLLEGRDGVHPVLDRPCEERHVAREVERHEDELAHFVLLLHGREVDVDGAQKALGLILRLG